MPVVTVVTQLVSKGTLRDVRSTVCNIFPGLTDRTTTTTTTTTTHTHTLYYPFS